MKYSKNNTTETPFKIVHHGILRKSIELTACTELIWHIQYKKSFYNLRSCIGCHLKSIARENDTMQQSSSGVFFFSKFGK